MRALLVLLFMAVSIQWGFAQLNLNVSRGTLGTVIEQIKSQSKYQFFYDDKLAALPVENVKVTPAFANASAETSPIPAAAPVTIVTFSFIVFMILLF